MKYVPRSKGYSAYMSPGNKRDESAEYWIKDCKVTWETDGKLGDSNTAGEQGSEGAIHP